MTAPSFVCPPKDRAPKDHTTHKDPTNHDFWYAPDLEPWNQNVRSLCLCGLLGPFKDALAAVGHVSGHNLADAAHRLKCSAFLG